jgi:very-short-patch-repair endonuclease
MVRFPPRNPTVPRSSRALWRNSARQRGQRHSCGVRNDSPFLVSEGIESGLSRQHLRSRAWDGSVHGVRMTPGEHHLAERCAAFALRMPPGAFFSHLTAAQLLGIPVPFHSLRSTAVHIAVKSPERAPHATQITGHQLDVGEADVITHRGLRMTSAVRTWRDLGAELPLLDLVAAGDFIIRWRSPLGSRFDLAAALGRAAGRRGVGALKQALELLDDRSESPPESMLRVIMRLGGLPSPRINHATIDSETGKQLRPDFTFDEYRTIIEYQGDYHRTKAQWRKDMTRRSRLEAQGWKVVELNWDDLKDPAELVRRIRALLAR